MKKTLLVTVAVLFGVALNAQISTWDGTAESWTKGSGTAEDPYLIESAQNLAYLAQQVNAMNTHTGNYFDVFADTWFLLTTDLDLGGNEGLLWTPIGKDNVANSIKTDFAGHFDGGDHTIYNMSIVAPENKKNSSFGLFGNAIGGSIKNITMASNCDVDIQYPILYYQAGVSVGSVLGFGREVVLENCVNYGVVRADVGYTYLSLSCGGLFGSVNLNSTILNSHNYGDVYCRGAVDYGALSPAGIVSYADGCDIIGCSNSGNITCIKSDFGLQERGLTAGGIVGVARGDCGVERCYNTGTLHVEEEYGQTDIPTSCGGIVGCSYTGPISVSLLIKNCYSVADISAINDNTDNKGNYAGGIFGGTYGYHLNGGIYTTDITIENCYFVGDVTADTIGGICAKEGALICSKSSVVTNSYYINTIESSNDYGASTSEEFMKSKDFVDMLNAEEIVFFADDNNVNNGYPVFEMGDQDFVEDIANNKDVSVYPNPAKDFIKIELSDNSSCQSIEIYSIDGRLVETFPETSSQPTIKIVNLTSGVYIVKVKLSDGKEYAERIIKE